MRKVLAVLIGSLLTVNCFAFETQTAVENSEFAGYVMRELDTTAEKLTVCVAKEFLIRIAMNMHRPLDVFYWDDEQADEVTNVVDNFCHLLFLGSDDIEYVTNEMWVTGMNLVDSTAALVETFGFERDKALNIAIKTIKDLNEEYGD